jgi:hypothetical protein
MRGGAKRLRSSFWVYVLSKREFDIAIYGVIRTPQMAKNGKNH